MTNVTRQLWNAAHTELIYYLVEHYNESCIDSNVTDAFPATSAARTCQLMTSVDRQQAAITLGHVIVTQCLGLCSLFVIEVRYLSFHTVGWVTRKTINPGADEDDDKSFSFCLSVLTAIFQVNLG